MNTPNPLHPQGAFLEHRGRSQVRIAVFTILAVHVVLLGALLLQGCKRTAEPPLLADQTNVPPIVPPPIEPLPPGVSTPPTDTVTPPTPPVVVPPPPPVVPEPPTVAGTEHTVIKGDTFGKLAKHYKVSVKAIADANPGVDSTRLKIGQKLNIPAPSATAPTTPAAAAVGEEKTYTVKSGDNLLKISKAYGVTVKQLRAANNLKTDQIKVGQKLKIPAKTGAPAVPATPLETAPTATSLPPMAPTTLPSTNF